MAQIVASQREIEFVLYEQLGADDYKNNEKFKGQDRKLFDLVLSEARNLAINELAPLLAEGDREGAKFENGAVTLPESFHRAYDLIKAGEWIAASVPEESGGQGLPHLMGQAIMDYIMGANYPLSLFGYSALGAGEIVEHFGTDLQKKLFMSKLYSGEWGGTMVLTEPNAGSDVGALETSAVKNGDGTYSITGNKIFITNAEHDLCDNIIHPVLARIEGAPKGTKGVSLFLVPKIWVNEDGSTGEPNDVACTGIEHKMGMHASPTCSLTFGEQGKCRGLLVGEENKGMRPMFFLMNAARLMVGAIGQTSASAAYALASNYARERRQGKALEDMMNPDAPQTAIINHPDVRRMLLWMKAHTEGMRSFIYYGAWLLDQQNCAETEKQREYCKDLLDLLTPVIKSYCTDRGFEVCSQAVQVYGGYGYTKEFEVEQLLRDVRIASIYEGTNGIQAMDLLGRKLGMKNGEVFMNLLNEMHEAVRRAHKAGLEAPASQLETAVNRLGETAMGLGKTAASGDFRSAFAFASPFLEAMGDVIMGWMLLWRATAAKPALEKIIGKAEGDARLEKINKNKNAAFYEGQIKSAEYFLHAVLPVAMGRLNAVESGARAAVEILEVSF